MRIAIKLSLIIFLVSCNAKKQTKKSEEIIAISYMLNLPMVSEGGQLYNMQDTTFIYYYQDLVLYQLPYHYNKVRIFTSVRADTTEQEDLQTETRYNFLIQKQGNNNGGWYETMNSEETKKISVDSMLSSRGLSKSLQMVLAVPDDTLIETVRETNDDVVIEKYIPKIRTDDPCCYDTALIYYSKNLKDISFSFSPKLDSMKSSKLFKFRAAFNEKYNPQYLMTMPRREIRYEVQQINVPNAKTITDFFQRYRQDEKSVL